MFVAFPDGEPVSTSPGNALVLMDSAQLAGAVVENFSHRRRSPAELPSIHPHRLVRRSNARAHGAEPAGACCRFAADDTHLFQFVQSIRREASPLARSRRVFRRAKTHRPHYFRRRRTAHYWRNHAGSVFRLRPGGMRPEATGRPRKKDLIPTTAPAAVPPGLAGPVFQWMFAGTGQNRRYAYDNLELILFALMRKPTLLHVISGGFA